MPEGGGQSRACSPANRRSTACSRCESWLCAVQGARVGSNVFIDSLDVSDLDMVNIGDGVVINEGATITGHYFRDGMLQFGAVPPQPSPPLQSGC